MTHVIPSQGSYLVLHMSTARSSSSLYAGLSFCVPHFFLSGLRCPLVNSAGAYSPPSFFSMLLRSWKAWNLVIGLCRILDISSAQSTKLCPFIIAFKHRISKGWRSKSAYKNLRNVSSISSGREVTCYEPEVSGYFGSYSSNRYMLYLYEYYSSILQVWHLRDFLPL